MTLSPGQHHLRVPREPGKNRAYRRELLARAEGDRDLQLAIIRYSREDILWWVNSLVWQYNPKKRPGDRVGPFVTWDFQERALLMRPPEGRGILWCYENDRTCVIEKSREVGASWLFLIFQRWLALFRRTQTLNVSKSADAVDCKSPDSLFWKIRFINEHLPPWFNGALVQEKMYIEYKDTHSVSTGEASTGRAGVGGRAGVIFVDEFSQIKEDREVRERTANTSDCRFFNGTHKGIETEFFRLTQQADQDDAIAKVVMHWSEHPEKNKGLYRVTGGKVEVMDKRFHYPADFKFVTDGSPTGGPYPGLRSPWYDLKCKDIGSDRGVAMDLDINPEGAMSQFFNALVIARLREEFCCPPLWEGDVEYDHDTGRGAKLVRRKGGKVRLWVMPDHNGLPPPARYTAGCDLAWGAGATPSVLTVFNADVGEKALEYADSTIEPTPCARLVFALLSLFRDPEGGEPRLCWEVNGPGAPFGAKLVELGYGNFYCHGSELPQSLVPKVGRTPGWNSGRGDEKKVTLERYRTALYERQFCNRSWPALKECLAFRYTLNGVEHAGQESADPAAARANHGDRVIADALAWKMARALGLWAPKKEERPPTVNSLAGRRLWRQDAELKAQEVWL